MKRYIRSNEYKGELELYQNKKNKNKYIEVKKGNDGHTFFRQFMYWNTEDGPVKNYSGSKTNRGRFHRETQASLNKILKDYRRVDQVHDTQDR